MRASCRIILFKVHTCQLRLYDWAFNIFLEMEVIRINRTFVL